MLHRVEMDVIHMGRIIPLVPDRVFPKSSLPDAAFPLPQSPDRPFRLPCNPSGKARLDVAHTPRIIDVALGQGPLAMHMVRQYDPGIDMEWPPRQFRSHGIPQCRNFDHQQVRAPVPQIYREEVGAPWHAIAAIVRYPDILCTNGAFQVLALGIVLTQVVVDQLKPFPAGQACGVLVLACRSTPYCGARPATERSVVRLNSHQHLDES